MSFAFFLTRTMTYNGIPKEKGCVLVSFNENGSIRGADRDSSETKRPSAKWKTQLSFSSKGKRKKNPCPKNNRNY